ncbi:MAG: GntR family transcriptional regulator [Kiloniellales bacterium]
MKTPVGLSKSMQVAQTLEREIRSGQIPHGDLLASEAALMRRFSVSRNTVRKGLEQLARQGMITTRSGIGSFVTYDGQMIDNALGWTLALAREESAIETRVLDLSRGASVLGEDKLGGAMGDALRLDRLRVLSASGLGISLERSRLPWLAPFAAVLEEGLPDGSLNRVLAESGLQVACGEEWAEVLPALSAADAAIMARPASTPMLLMKRLTRSADGAVIEYVESLLDPDRFGLHLTF